MKKDFDQWNKIKKRINVDEENRLYHERVVWWCALGVNVGYEQDGSGGEYRRPVLILKGFSAGTCLVVPLTKSSRKHKLRMPIGRVSRNEAHAILSQMRVVDTKRLIRKIGYIGKAIFENIRKTVKDRL